MCSTAGLLSWGRQCAAKATRQMQFSMKLNFLFRYVIKIQNQKFCKHMSPWTGNIYRSDDHPTSKGNGAKDCFKL